MKKKYSLKDFNESILSTNGLKPHRNRVRNMSEVDSYDRIVNRRVNVLSPLALKIFNPLLEQTEALKNLKKLRNGKND